MAFGIDVYTAYQNVTDWTAVRAAGVEFCYVKVSDGLTIRATNGYGPKGRAAGVKMGAYHFAQAGDPIRQANLLCDQAEANGLTDLAVCLDAEAPGTMTTGFCIPFLRQIQARGHRPCLYASNSTMQAIQGAVKAALPDCLFWVARYAGTNSTAKLRPTVPWDVHQYSQAGRVSGVSAGSVDLNDGIIPLNSTDTGPEPGRDFSTMSDSFPAPQVLPDGTYRYHFTLSNWDKVFGRYVSLSCGFTGCSFFVWMQRADGSYVSAPSDIPSGSYGKVLQGTLAQDNVHWLGIPSGVQSVSVDVKPAGATGAPGVTLFTDGK